MKHNKKVKKIKTLPLFHFEKPEKRSPCDAPECLESGLYRAPKSRETLNQYYWFCLEHIRLYNQSWDYYRGMSEAEIEFHKRFDSTWQRPTWRMSLKKYSQKDIYEQEALKAKLWWQPIEMYLAILELRPPVTMAQVKTQHKHLVKTYHPDLNDGCTTKEDLLKKINHAYSMIKAFLANNTK